MKTIEHQSTGAFELFRATFVTLWPRISDVPSKNLVAEFGEPKVSSLESGDIGGWNLVTLESRIW